LLSKERENSLLMRVLTNTNIIVDDFDYCKNYPKGTFIHFLTHYHADHYEGMSPGWDYGPIYCSQITKNLIEYNFPNITNIHTVEMNKRFVVPLNKDGTKTIHATFFDANHIPGSVMILFEGYMGTILHTGDMRFKDSMLLENTVLYPEEKRNRSNHKCSIHVDELIFDNTYINPVHQFPDREKAIQMVIDIIEKNKNKHIIISMGILGKERIALEVARHFQTTLLIPERKYRHMQAMNFPVDQMTTDPTKNYWIEVIHKHLRESRLEEEKRKGNKNFIMLSVEFTVDFGQDQLKACDGINYLVPYSQHSNYGELEKFIKSICPSILRKLVLPYLNRPQFKNRPINNLAPYFGYVKSLAKGGKSAFTHFIKSFTDISKLSAEYKRWMNNDAQKELMNELKIPISIDTSKRRVVNKKKKELEEELKKLTNTKDLDIKALGDKIFHASKPKRGNFAGTTAHKMAVNTTQNLALLLNKMALKGKTKTTQLSQEKVEEIKENAEKERGEKICKKLKGAADLKSLGLVGNSCIKPQIDFQQDQDLFSLFQRFVEVGPINMEVELARR